MSENFKIQQRCESLTNTNEKTSRETKTFNKIIVQNVLTESNTNNLKIHKNNENTIVKRIKDFGMFGSVNNVNTKKWSRNTKLSPKNRQLIKENLELQNNTSENCVLKPKADKILCTPKSSKKNFKQLSNEKNTEGLDLHKNKPLSTPGRKGLPLPQAVARRNARERNRVKQVNNGFAALRERIPEEVAAVFDTQGSGRGASKKLSKVETLRMAVEYIRSLERLLGVDFPISNSDSSYTLLSGQGSSSEEDSFLLVKDECTDLSENQEHFDDSISNLEMDEYLSSSSTNTSHELNFSNKIEALPSISTLNGLQHLKRRGSSTYQMFAQDFFMNTCTYLKTSENKENEHAQTQSSLRQLSPKKINQRICDNIEKSLFSHRNEDTLNGTSSNLLLEQEHVAPITYRDQLFEKCALSNFNEHHLIKPEQITNSECYKITEPVKSTSQKCAINQPPQLHYNAFSPSLDRLSMQETASTPGIQAFYEQDKTASFYEGVVDCKKELNVVFLDTSATPAALSDESMIEAIDWWEAHTPKSDGGTVVS